MKRSYIVEIDSSINCGIPGIDKIMQDVSELLLHAEHIGGISSYSIKIAAKNNVVGDLQQQTTAQAY